ncbi:discoidin domain-containing protein [Paenibacillus oenotherae]|uniref:Discoidin domain-containing protein n=1 Tax=Paenibacillus oenotherae TaxID=1435645 RepID=A0ABS7D4G0_9BACL|nr:discoidin domain-containing protein [Paenibacillus oenotherae]MBW7474083.1 discoidin domain-containing protein [Paenibacillus oenotherae]
MQYINITPVFTSAANVGDVSIIAPSSVNTAPYLAFDSSNSTQYRSGISPVFPDYIGLNFNRSVLVKRYSITFNGFNLTSWTLEGSNNNFGSFDVLHTVSNFTSTNLVEYTFDLPTLNRYKSYRIRALARVGTNSWGISDLKFHELVYNNKVMVKVDGNYKRFNESTHKTSDAIPALSSNISSSKGTAIASSFYSAGYEAWKAFNDLTDLGWSSLITTTGWLGFDFTVPIIIGRYTLKPKNWNTADQYNGTKCAPKTWTFEASNDGNNWSVLDTIDNMTDWTLGIDKVFTFKNYNPYKMYRINVSAINGGFSLTIGEMQMMEVNVMQHWQTVTSSQPTEQQFLTQGMDLDPISKLTNEDFQRLDPSNNKIELVYYTEETAKTSAQVQITGNLSLLDELTNPELVLWSTDSTIAAKTVTMSAIPHPQLVIPTSPIPLNGQLQSILTTINQSGLGAVSMVASSDGVIWKSILNGAWQTINIENAADVRLAGMTSTVINAVTQSQWENLSPSGLIRIAYFLEQRTASDVAAIASMHAAEKSIISTPLLLSTVIAYNELNHQYSGLMFMDASQNYYSTSLGEVLKYLNFGTLIAGQTSLDVKVILANTNPFDVQNIRIHSQHAIDGLILQLSKSNAPFIGEETLTFDQVLAFDNTLDFYIRLVVDPASTGGGNFDIHVEADPA